MSENDSVPFDGEQAALTLAWIKSLPPPASAPKKMIDAARHIPNEVEIVSEDMYAHYLSDGMILGYLMSALDSSMSAKLEAMQLGRSSPLPYVDEVYQRKRIGIFLQYAHAVGVDEPHLFKLDQLHRRTGLGQVVLCLNTLRNLP